MREAAYALAAPPAAGPEIPRASGASAAAIQAHYDVGNDFFARWLDERLVYTCALWSSGDPGQTLEAAQAAKIDFFWDRLLKAPGGRVLDIGSGWGGALARGVEQHGVCEGVGLTLSAAQKRYVDSLGSPEVVCIEQSWADYEPDQPFDAIVSIESIEAFVRRGLSRQEKVATYRELFERCHRWLKPGGGMGLQMIAYGAAGPEAFDSFIAEQIFPESDLPELSEVLEACAGRFEVVSLQNDRQQYVRTLRAWLGRLKAARSAAAAHVGSDTVRRFEDYLRLSWFMFADGGCDLHRVVLRRIDHPKR
jgi:cyclopropane-fatty-acyl-phospholipid synthase